MANVVIIGGGIGGLMAAFNIASNSDHNVTIIDKGNFLSDRHCPAGANKECAHCKICSITSGYAGAGAYSDGKFNIGTAYGGTLADEIGEVDANFYIEEVDKILEKFYPTKYPECYQSSEELKLKCLQNNLRLLDMKVRHLGSDFNRVTMQNLIDAIKSMKNVKMHARTEVTGISRGMGGKYCVECGDTLIPADHVVISTGRSGSDFVKHVCKMFDVPIDSNSVDIGVRVEMNDSIWREFSDKIYEPKILYKTKTFEDNTRMFCFNQGGYVSTENNGGVITANGYSNADPFSKSGNCNFAILSSIHFDGDFHKPTEYAENIAKNMNFAGEGNIIVQRFGDLIRGRRTTESRLAKNTVIPTIKAFPGDISIVMPYRPLTNIIETIYALDKVAPGTANDDTLLYGCENKYYSMKPKHDKSFAIAENIYLIGDGSGISRGLSQAGAMGIYVGNIIASK